MQQNAQVVVSIRVFWIYANDGSIRRLGSDQLAFGPQYDTEIVVCVGMVRIECDRAAIRGDRFVQLESILKDDSEIAMPVRATGLELETSLDQRNCLFAPLLLMREHS